VLNSFKISSNVPQTVERFSKFKTEGKFIRKLASPHKNSLDALKMATSKLGMRRR
jgi:hypothetical protein